MSDQSTAPVINPPITDDHDEEDDAPPPAKGTPPTAETVDWKAEAEKWRTHARSWEGKAKTNSQAAKELEQLRKATMSDQEKAVEAARQEARQQAIQELGTARAEDAIRFSVGERLPEKELDDLLGDLNLARFLNEDGTVNRQKVASYVERIVPPTKTFPDLGQGARGAAEKPSDMNRLIRKGAGL